MAFEKRTTQHFCVFFEAVDEKSVKQIGDLIEGFYNNVTDSFGVKNENSIDFYICPSVESYIELTNKTKENYQDWMVGWTDFKLRKICILSPRIVKDRTFEDMKKVICHEIVHIVLDSLANSDDVELWMSEGIATLLANQIESEFVDEQDFPLLKDLHGDDNFADNGGYDYCGVYVWYFIKKYGIDRFVSVYTRKERLDEYLSSSFEKDAVNSYIAQSKHS